MENAAINGKKIAAGKAIEYIRSGMTLGLGTGSTAYWAIQGIGEQVKQGLSVRAIATSLQSESLARELGIPIVPFSEIDHLDITIDGADEVDEKLNLIKGGGGALLREKIVASATRFYIIIVDESKLVHRLGKFPLPVEVIPMALPLIARALEKMDFVPTLRLKADGARYITDEGNLILDCSGVILDDPERTAKEIDSIVGVVEHGLFLGMADLALIAHANEVVERTV